MATSSSSSNACESARRRPVLIYACLAAFAFLPGAVAAQQTREEVYKQEQEVKSAHIAPSTRNVAERVVDRLRQFGVFDDEPKGFYPFLTKVYPSGGVAVGGGYRRAFRDTGAITATTAVSFRNFKSAGVQLAMPRMAGGKLAVETGLHWIDAPTVPFFGIGNDTVRDGMTDFHYRPTTAGVTLRYEPHRAFTLGGGVDYLTIDATAGPSPSLQPLVFASAPGLGADPRYVRSRAFAAIDWRADPGFTGRGGLYRLDVDQYAETSGSDLSFRRLETEVVQLVPILRANWVIALRGLATITQTTGDNEVPFYLMPTLGGGSDLRGFSTMRFRGPQRVLVGAELRWTPARVLDMAVFYDAGKVAERARDLTLTGLHDSYGIGARFHAHSGASMRIELAHSREHAMRVIWSFGAAF
jgi:hypothetical protein